MKFLTVNSTKLKIGCDCLSGAESDNGKSGGHEHNERILDRLIELEPDQPAFPLRKAICAFFWKGDLRGARTAYEALAPSTKDDPSVTNMRVYLAMCARDFAAAREILSKTSKEEVFFLGALAPRQIWELWLEFIKGNHPTVEQFGAAREQLHRKVENQIARAAM